MLICEITLKSKLVGAVFSDAKPKERALSSLNGSKDRLEYLPLTIGDHSFQHARKSNKNMSNEHLCACYIFRVKILSLALQEGIESTLELKKSFSSDAGLYRCKIRSELATNSTVIYLSVVGKNKHCLVTVIIPFDPFTILP